MTLEDLGYNTLLEKFRIEHDLINFEIGRVIAEHKERYVVKTVKGEFHAEITGNMRFTARNREDFPAVGDWVALTAYDDDFAIIHAILPRFSIIKRQAVGQFGEVQIIAANIDFAFIVQAADRDFNINRIERYLTICYTSKVTPLIVLTKTDLFDDSKIDELKEKISQRITHVPVFPVSNETQKGYEALYTSIEKGKTYCLIGSSGVGKSSLLNNLSGKSLMKTGSISESTNKGKHVTTHRELILLEKGGILIDNPGMKEVGIADTAGGLEAAFDSILQYSESCKFKDCTHTTEAGCSVIEAVENGELDKESYQNYLKLEREKKHFEMTTAEKRKKDKIFGKMMKNYKKDFYKKK